MPVLPIVTCNECSQKYDTEEHDCLGSPHHRLECLEEYVISLQSQIDVLERKLEVVISRFPPVEVTVPPSTEFKYAGGPKLVVSNPPRDLRISDDDHDEI